MYRGSFQYLANTNRPLIPLLHDVEFLSAPKLNNNLASVITTMDCTLHGKISKVCLCVESVGGEKLCVSCCLICLLSGRWGWREPGRSRPGKQTSEAELLQRLPTKVQTKVCMLASLMQGCNNRRMKYWAGSILALSKNQKLLFKMKLVIVIKATCTGKKNVPFIAAQPQLAAVHPNLVHVQI